MVTTVGLSDNLETVVPNLIKLEYAATEAYQEAADRLENKEYSQQILEFKQDHLRHIEELTTLAQKMFFEVPTGPDAKVILTTGKVKMADLLGDQAILMAMKTNEDDTVSAYERSKKIEGISAEAKAIFERGFADETRHRKWMETTIKNFSKKAA